ncbi:hypothetical protein Pelo_190 [Pelomyxa schiedti]|nr:hypothetical protein Pelo_190 [Pelomyxa schiedti]
MVVSDEVLRQIALCSVVSESLSVVGSSYLLLLILSLRLFKSFRIRMVMWLSVADLVAHVAVVYALGFTLPGNSVPKTSCVIAGVFQELSLTSYFMTSACISFILYCVIVRNMSHKSPKWFRATTFVIGILLVGALISLIAGLVLGYGQVGDWCWILTTNNVWFLYPLIWLCFSITTVMYILIVVHVKGHLTTSALLRENKSVNAVEKKQGTIRRVAAMLAPYPLITLVCWIPASINRFCLFAGYTVVPIYFLHAILSGAEGFLNAIVFTWINKAELVSQIRACRQKALKPIPVDVCDMEEEQEATDYELERKTDKRTEPESPLISPYDYE